MATPQKTPAQFTHLLSPLPITHPGGTLELRNRVLVSAHVPGFAANNQPGDNYISYHRRYAAEGVGLQITGGTPVHRSGMLSLRSDALWNLNDQIIPGYQKLADAVHAEGGRMLAQLAHSGGTVYIDQPGYECWSASSVRSSITGHVSHAMSLAQIKEVIQAFANAAGRVQQGGLDGVELLAAFGFLPQAFLSPLTNHRHDDYGGSLENRMRFLIEVLQAVRSQLGSRQILGVRLPGDEFEPGGLTIEDMKLVCTELCQRNLVDYFNIIAHTNFTHTGRSKHWAPTPTPHGVFVDLAAAIKHCVNKPVFTVGRVVSPFLAEKIIAQGNADMVGMTRAHLCDPTIVSKITTAQAHQIRPCVGANTCIANRYAGKTISCMHNPELKSPGKRLTRSRHSKKVSVIGAGPAGLEAARLAAERGHHVSVYEKNPVPGGQLNYWTSVRSTAELKGIVQWRLAELQRLNVHVITDTPMTDTDVFNLSSEVVIIATGATDRTRRLPGHCDIPVLSPMQLLDRDHITANRALVISDGRGQCGLVCAEWLLQRGADVEVVSEDIAVANDLDATNRNSWYERLGSAGVTLTAQVVIEAVSQRQITLRNPYTTQTMTRQGVDLIVDWQGAQSSNTLIEACGNSDTTICAIGDCVSPRSVEIAMTEALNVATAI